MVSTIRYHKRVLMRVKKILGLLLIGVLAFTLMTVPSFAQGELSLEGLATKIQDLVTRVERIEAIWSGPDAVVTAEGTCRIAMEQSVQDSSVIKYKEAFDEWPDMDYIRIQSIEYDEDSEHILITHKQWHPERFILEIWDGCQFVESTDWWEDE